MDQAYRRGQTTIRPVSSSRTFTAFRRIALQVKPVGMTLSPMDFRATHLILTLRRLCFAYTTDTAQVRRSAPGNHRRSGRSVRPAPASLPLAGRRRRRGRAVLRRRQIRRSSVLRRALPHGVQLAGIARGRKAAVAPVAEESRCIMSSTVPRLGPSAIGQPYQRGQTTNRPVWSSRTFTHSFASPSAS